MQKFIDKEQQKFSFRDNESDQLDSLDDDFNAQNNDQYNLLKQNYQKNAIVEIQEYAFKIFNLTVMDYFSSLNSMFMLLLNPNQDNFHLFHHHSSHAIFGDIFKDAAHKFESGLEEVIADLYCEFFTNAQGIAAAFTPETISLYEFLWANAGCSLSPTTLGEFSFSKIQCEYSTAFQVKQLWDPSKYKTA